MDSLFFRRERKPSLPGEILRKILRNRRLTVGIILGVPVLLFVLFGSRGVVQRIRLDREKTELQEKLRVEEANERRLRAELKALEGDPRAIEKVARERHSMHRRGETVYKIRRED
jgi:cell division protein FtsB